MLRLGILTLLALCLGAAAGSGLRSELEAAIETPGSLQLTAALKLLRSVQFPDESIPKDLVIGPSRTPLLHHLFNLFMLSSGSSERQKISELIDLSVAKGANVFARSNPSAMARYEPDLSYKAIFTRNVTLARAIARRMKLDAQEVLREASSLGAARTGLSGIPATRTTFDTLHLLHLLPCEPVPLAKMLLHGNNIVRQQIAADAPLLRAASAADGPEEIHAALTQSVLALLTGAKLENSNRNKFSFNGHELAHHSARFNASVSEFVQRELEVTLRTAGSASDIGVAGDSDVPAEATEETSKFAHARPNDVSLRTLMGILQDVTASVHGALLDDAFDSDAVRSDAAAAGFGDEEAVAALKALRLQQLQDELPALLGTVNARGRNLFHMLAVSHSHRIVHKLFLQLLGVLFRASGSSEEDAGVEGELLRSTVLHALVQRDVRGHSPLSLAMVRYGRNSAVYVGLVNLLHLATASSRSLLAQRVSDCDSSQGLPSFVDAAAGSEQHEAEESENFELLGELLQLIDYLSLPVDTLGGSPQASQDSAQDAADVRRKWSASLLDSGGWQQDELVGDGVAEQDGAIGSRADTVERYRESYAHHFLHSEDDHVKESSAPSCDIEEVFISSYPSSAEFFQKYINMGKPVIFRGLALDSRIREVFQKANFLRRYGEDRVPISTIPYAGSFGQKSSGNPNNVQYVTMNELANNQSASTLEVRGEKSVKTEHNYAFTTARPEWSNKIAGDIGVPPLIQEVQVDDKGDLTTSKEIELQFYLGPPGSGAPMHIHGHAVNTLAFGRKHWFLYPPSDAFYATQPAVDFVREDVRAKHALQCTQFGGDVIFVPALWGHATFNERQSIGVAHELSVEQFCME